MGEGRLVPHHGSGGGLASRRNDPDETEGRAIYRATADTIARAQSRRVRLLTSAAATIEQKEGKGEPYRTN